MFLLFITTMFASGGDLKSQNRHGQEPCGAESDLHWLGDRGQRSVGCYGCEQGSALATGDGSIREGESCGLLMRSGASGAAVLEPKHRDPRVPSHQTASRLPGMHGTGSLALFCECLAFSDETRELTPLLYPY